MSVQLLRFDGHFLFTQNRRIMDHLKLGHLSTIKNKNIWWVVYWNLVYWKANTHPRKRTGESLELLSFICTRIDIARMNAGIPTSFDDGGAII